MATLFDAASHFLLGFLAVMALLFIFAVGLGLIAVIVLYIIDVTQAEHAIRRNFPVIGRFRYFFEHLGEFFRQYFFAMDQEEMPFNRAQRSWVYRAAKNIDNTRPFGSTRDLGLRGTIVFVNSPYPTLKQDAAEIEAITFGPYTQKPYTTNSIVNISGMSFGALSAPAVRALSTGAKIANCWMNTGEGGLSPYHLEGGCDVVFQIGTAKYGIRDLDGNLSNHKLSEVAANDQVKMFELKLSQGAKPGKGGILPGAKVTKEIARIRGIQVRQDSISPNRHPDINNNAELLSAIDRIRQITGKPVGFKAVMGAQGWLDSLFEEVDRRGIESAPDFITVDGAEGGTGAAPMPLMDHMGLPIREGLPLLVDKLSEYGLRNRTKVIASGKLITPADVCWAICMGADAVVTARGFMFALGCIQALQCNKNTCPSGITTHNPRLQKGLNSAAKSIRVANYHKNLVLETSMIAHSCGTRSPRGLQRSHAREVMEDGRSVPLNQLYPLPEPQARASV